MDSYLHAFLINRDPPNIQDVQDLAKVYGNSRELLKSGPINIEEIPELKPLGIKLNGNTVLLCTTLPVIRYFPHQLLEEHRTNYNPYSYLILDLAGTKTPVKSIDFLLRAIDSERKIAVHIDWRKALLKAMQFESNRGIPTEKPQIESDL